jgi:hypothetical protein
MKKAIIFLILGIGWSSCKEEASLGIGYPPLEGTWKLVRKSVFNDSVYVPKAIENPALHTLTFASDGTLSSMGEETSYYRSSKYYKVDSVRFVGQRVGFIVGSIYPPFYQGLILKGDSLRLSPCPDHVCDLVFVKGR